MLDDFPRLRWDSVGEEHLELHHQVAPPRWAAGDGQALATEAPHGTGPDHVAAWQGHEAVVQRGNIDRAAAKRLEEEDERRTSSCVNGRITPKLQNAAPHRILEIGS